MSKPLRGGGFDVVYAEWPSACLGVDGLRRAKALRLDLGAGGYDSKREEVGK